MKRLWHRVVVLTAAVTLVTVFGLGGPDRVHAEPTALRLGTDVFPPFEYTEHGRVVGLSTEIVTSVLDSMGVAIEWIEIFPWSRAMQLVESGEIDVLYSGVRVRERRHRLHFPETPLVESKWVVVVRSRDKDRFPFESWDDLKRGRVGIVRGYRHQDDFDEFLGRHVVHDIASENYQNLLKLRAGRVDYVVCDYLNCLFLIQRMRLAASLHIYEDNPISHTRYYAMFSKATVDAAFVRRFDVHLRSLKGTTVYAALIRSFMDSGERPP